MTGHTDFLALFQELGLSASCSLDEFKLAFRRRVAQLHPDRERGGRIADAELRLQRLTAMYGAALDFHRRHGRLPGYTTQAPESLAAQPRRTASIAAEASSDAPRKPTSLLVIAAIAVLLLAFWLLDGSVGDEVRGDGSSTTMPDGAESSSALPVEAGKTLVYSPPPLRLKLGMNRRDALAAEGEPLSSTEDQWDYGPSWIAFRCGRVSDWYSSPMRPLRASKARPSPDDPMPTLRAIDCASVEGP